MGGLLLVINPGWTQDYLTRIRAACPAGSVTRIRTAIPPEHRDPHALRQHRRSDSPHERLDALGRVQSRLMSGLVQEKVRRAIEQPPQG